MKTMNFGTERETYAVEVKYSILWEVALGIAAYTYPEIHHTLSERTTYWTDVEGGFSEELVQELTIVQNYNTWYAILQLLHLKEFKTIEEFTEIINSMDSNSFIHQCLPYIGTKYEDTRKEISMHNNKQVILEWIHATKNHKYFSGYIDYLVHTDINFLKRHIHKVFTLWYQSVVSQKENEMIQVLENDFQQKSRMKPSFEAIKFVEYVTNGIEYQPEPSVHQVLLIPQLTYRPWNLEMNLFHTKVFFYPVSDEHITNKEAPPEYLINAYKSLSDETRLKILKQLSNGDHTLQELTDRLHIPKTTLHHHLSLLRSAQIVKVSKATYTLSEKNLHSLFMKTKHFLGIGE